MGSTVPCPALVLLLSLLIGPGPASAASPDLDRRWHTKRGLPRRLGGGGGNVDGDSLSDVIVGAYLHRAQRQEKTNGAGFRLPRLGGRGSPRRLPGRPKAIRRRPRFGDSVATAGDVNGVGFSDVIVGAWQYSRRGGPGGEGGGGPGRPPASPPLRARPSRASISGAQLGTVATAGDVNGRRVPRMSSSAPGALRTARTRRATSWCLAAQRPVSPRLRRRPSRAMTLTATWVIRWTTAGDVNADGFDDVIVGHYYYDNGGNGTTTDDLVLTTDRPAGFGTSPAWTTEGSESRRISGTIQDPPGDLSMATVSDDVIVAAACTTTERPNEGRALVFHGSVAGLRPPLPPGSPRRSGWRSTSDLRRGQPGRRWRSVSRMSSSVSLSVRQRPGRGRGTDFCLPRVYRLAARPPPTGRPRAITPTLGSGFAAGTGRRRGRAMRFSRRHRRRPAVQQCSVLGGACFCLPRGKQPRCGREPAAGGPLPVGIRQAQPLSRPRLSSRTGLPERCRVRLAVYDLAGRKMTLLTAGMREPGLHRETWDGRGSRGAALPAACTWLRLAFAGAVETAKIVLARSSRGSAAG